MQQILQVQYLKYLKSDRLLKEQYKIYHSGKLFPVFHRTSLRIRQCRIARIQGMVKRSRRT